MACLTALLVCTAGCGADAPADTRLDSETPTREATSLAFVPGGVLKLLPLELADINLAAGPPDQYLVRFALLADRPDAAPNDASLDRAEAITDPRGVATVTLTAPSSPSTFTVRAAIGDLEAHLPVSVSDQGYGTVIAQPVYTGTRPIETWVASVRSGSSCADLAGFPPPDGALVATTSSTELPTIDSVPVGPIASVSVRSGHFAYGCTNVADLNTDEVRTVPIDVADRPMELSGELALSLGIDDQGEEWSTLLTDAIASSLDAFRNGALDDVQMLLDGMEALSTDPEGFQMLSAMHDFYAVVQANLSEATLTDRARTWLEAGVENLEPLQGELELRNNSAAFRLLSAGGVPTEESGFLGTATWSAFSDPGDTLVLGGPLRFQVNRWVVALANGPALEQFPAAADAAEALVLVTDCPLIASNLSTAAGGSVGGECDATCAQHLCEAAIVTAWARAGDAGGELTRIAIGVTGTAQVDDEARPVSLDGTWLGTLAGPSSAVGGAAEGTLADEP